MIEGGCNCKAIRYRIDAKPVVVAQCHCRNCQRQSGSAFSVNLMVPAAKVETTGELSTYVDHDTASGNPVYRRFCGRCGSPIFSDLHEGNGMTIVKAGTLDDPGAFAPVLSVWTSTALPWVTPAGKAFERNPG
jgi:hypothetical protein